MQFVAPFTNVAMESPERALKAVHELPPFSPVLNRLMATLSSENVSIPKTADIIETDTVIAGNVLKLVNSALYGRRGTVNSVRHAVSLLGINKLRNTVFAMSISRVWNQVRAAPGWPTARFNLHAVACGLMCDTLAQRARVGYPEGAFAAGLFHDLGLLLLAVGMPREFEHICRLYTEESVPLLEAEQDVVGTTHAELSAEALAIWNLPVPIQTAVRFMNGPEHEPGSGRPHGAASLALALRCANDYVNQAGMTLLDRDESEAEGIVEPFAPLGIEMENATFIDAFRTELRALSSVLQG